MIVRTSSFYLRAAIRVREQGADLRHVGERMGRGVRSFTRADVRASTNNVAASIGTASIAHDPVVAGIDSDSGIREAVVAVDAIDTAGSCNPVPRIENSG